MAIQVNQCEYASLVALGYSGSVNKMRRDWEKDNTIITSTDFYKKLIEAGYTGAFPDMERDFWCEGGGSFNQIIGWTDGFDCTGGGTNDVIVQFPTNVSFIDQTDISIYTDTGKNLILPTPPTIDAATNRINYGSNWDIPLVSTDVVYWAAAANNTYELSGDTVLTQIYDAVEGTFLNNYVEDNAPAWIETSNEIEINSGKVANPALALLAAATLPITTQGDYFEIDMKRNAEASACGILIRDTDSNNNIRCYASYSNATKINISLTPKVGGSGGAKSKNVIVADATAEHTYVIIDNGDMIEMYIKGDSGNSLILLKDSPDAFPAKVAPVGYFFRNKPVTFDNLKIYTKDNRPIAMEAAEIELINCLATTI